MFIQTEATPNPATLKFLPGKVVLEEGTREFRDASEAEPVSPLAARLFAVDGVTGVFLGSDFISVTKDRREWQLLKPTVLGAIMEHFLSGEPVVTDGHGAGHPGEDFDPKDAEVVRPAVANDGGDIIFRGFRSGIVYLKMQGACSGCPSSTATLRHGIENLLKHFIPEVEEVQPV
jgi:scaffold Nfu/NifU family protein/NifU-like protein